MSSGLIVLLFCRHIAELIFYMEELRAHVRKYGPVMQRYYVQYLSGFDAVVLNELVQVRMHFKSHELVYMWCYGHLGREGTQAAAPP